MTDIPAGIFRHYKGPLYLAFGLAHDANAEDLAVEIDEYPGNWRKLLDRKVVVYISLQLDGAHFGPRLAVRTLSDFVAPVCGVKECPHYGQKFDPDPYGGCIRCKEAPVPRFTYLGPELTKEMTA